MTMHDKPEKIRKYAPVFENIFAPLTDWCDPPYRCVRINDEWVKLIVGVMEVLRWPDLYDNANDRAEHVARSVQGLMDSMMDDDCSDLDVCELVASCITNSTGVQVALVDAAATNGTNYAGGGYPTTPVSPQVTQENLLSEAFTCDEDHAFATARALVEGIHKATLEVFQAIELLTNPVDLAAEVADNIPVVGFLVATALDVVLWIKQTIWELYWAAWDDEVRDEIACDVYCVIMQDPDCSISFDQIFDVYKSAISVPTPPDDAPVGDWIDWMIGVPLTVKRTIVSTGAMMGLISLKFGAKFADWNLGIRSIKLIIALASDETSNDWELLCSVCVEAWIATCNLVVPVLPPSIEIVWGDFVPDSGVWAVCDEADPENRVVRIKADPGQPYDMTRSSFDFKDRTLGNNATVSSIAAAIDAEVDGLPGANLAKWTFGQVLTGDRRLTVIGQQNITGFTSYMVRSDRFGCGGQVRMTNVEVRGSGPNPFETLEGWVIT